MRDEPVTCKNPNGRPYEPDIGTRLIVNRLLVLRWLYRNCRYHGIVGITACRIEGYEKWVGCNEIVVSEVASIELDCMGIVRIELDGIEDGCIAIGFIEVDSSEVDRIEVDIEFDRIEVDIEFGRIERRTIVEIKCRYRI